MLRGLVQDDLPLGVRHILERLRRLHGAAEVVSVGAVGDVTRATYADVAERVDRLAAALARLGAGPGERVATFGWNSQRHLELYLAVPCLGAVLHTLNIRLHPDQIAYVANHAEDRVVFVDASLVPVLAEVAPRLETVRHWVVMGDGDHGPLPGAIGYEELLAAERPGFDWPAVDDRAAAGLCYTSGTTGHPKGVLYSHRSTLLHAAMLCMADTNALSCHDRVLPAVPMFHASAWGLPYGAALTGASLVMPGPHLGGEALGRLIERERVTFAAGVPTVWSDLLRHADRARPDLSSLRMIAAGGAPVPRSLMEAFAERHGVTVLQEWGMTEMSPLGAVALPPPGLSGEEHWRVRARTGRIVPFVEARLVDDAGAEVPWDGAATGELEVRGPFVASDYYRAEDAGDRFDGGWLRTGDIASIDAAGFVKITDRAKDVVKSGGEWISSVELEGELVAHPAVVEAAVIAAPDQRWGERPLACVVPAEDGSAELARELREHLAGRVAKWWVPERFAFIDEVPKTSVGKFDKKLLRARLAAGELELVGAAGAAAAPRPG